MRLFICFVLFVLLYSCASDSNKFKRNEKLLYQVQWLGDNHVKVHFDTLTTTSFGDCSAGFVKSYEILNDTAWLEVKTSIYSSKEQNWVKGRKHKTDTLRKNAVQSDSLITIATPNNLVKNWVIKNDTFSHIPKEEKIALDSVAIIIGGCVNDNIFFTFKNDSIFITKPKKHVIAWMPNRFHFDLYIPDTLKIKGAATDSILFSINTALDITELDSLNKRELIGMTHAVGSRVEIYTQGQKFENSKLFFSSGIQKLIKLALTIEQKDLE